MDCGDNMPRMILYYTEDARPLIPCRRNESTPAGFRIIDTVEEWTEDVPTRMRSVVQRMKAPKALLLVHDGRFRWLDDDRNWEEIGRSFRRHDALLMIETHYRSTVKYTAKHKPETKRSAPDPRNNRSSYRDGLD